MNPLTELRAISNAIERIAVIEHVRSNGTRGIAVYDDPLAIEWQRLTAFLEEQREIMHKHMPAMLAVCEAANLADRYTGTTASGTGDAARVYKRLSDALEKLRRE